MESRNCIDALIGECLRRMPADVLPQEHADLVSAETSITTAGERILTIRLKSETSAYSPAERLIPALAATVCSFMPNIDLVRAYIGQETVLRAGGFTSPDGLFEPDTFRALVGSSAQLFFMAEDGSLRRQEHAIARCDPSARDLITALIDLQNVFPQGTLAQDILGVHIEDHTAHINLSAALYSICQPLSAEEERALVYSIVNTLVYNLDTVLRVQFYIDGAVADTFAGSISIHTPLMANPGLIKG